MLFHPTDTFLTIKQNRDKKLTLPAFIIVAMLLFSRFCYISFLHYPVSPFDLRSVNIPVDLLIHLAVVISVALASWNVSEIMSGETFLRESLINVALATMPMVLLYIPTAAISNIFGQSEQMFLTIISVLMWGWSFFLFFRGLMVLNDYTFARTLAVCLLCVVYIAILWGVILVLVVFSKNLWQFLEGFITEIMVSLS